LWERPRIAAAGWLTELATPVTRSLIAAYSLWFGDSLWIDVRQLTLSHFVFRRLSIACCGQPEISAGNEIQRAGIGYRLPPEARILVSRAS
jgi:hypothetical protein